MMRWVREYMLFCVLLVCSMGSIARQSTDIPELLKPWQDWVLRNDSQLFCPRPHHDAEQFMCSWPSEIKITISTEGADFEQKGVLYQAGWVMLPGDTQNWPEKVTHNTQTLPVIEENGKPFVYLEKGDFLLKGELRWTRMPERLAVPQTTGLLHLYVAQNKVDTSDRDQSGYVWLQKTQQQPEVKIEEDALSLKVYRKLQDGIPQESLQLFRMNVTGKEREVLIGPVIDHALLPLFLQTPLPARLEDDGRLRIQVKPGSWDIYLNSRYLKQTNTFTLSERAQPWPQEELWVLEPKPQFRQFEASGALSVDPTQTDLPAQWRQFPTYLMKAGTTLSLQEKQRGKVFERGEQLQLQREMWLDFDGQGFVVQDQVSGVIEDNWRISALQPYRLGRVTINHEDQLITILPKKEDTDSVEITEPGVEIRNGHLRMTAVSTIEDRTQTMPVIGWNRDVKQMSGVLHLPPGWQLWNVIGVDKVSDAWLRNWNLLDLFLVLLIGLSVFKLLGWLWGIVALVTLALIYQEPHAPVYSWLWVLAGLGLLKVMPDGGAKHWTKIYTVAAMTILVCIAIPFISQQIQTALYPQLNPPDSWAQPYVQKSIGYAQQEAGMAAADLDQMAMEAPQRTMEALSAPVQSLKREAKQLTDQERTQAMNQYDPDAKLQTGPGVPRWSWQRIQLTWQGPVTKDQQIQFWLLSDTVVSLLKVLHVILVLGLIGIFGRHFYQQYGRQWSSVGQVFSPKSHVITLLMLPMLLCLGSGLQTKSAFANLPDPTLLEDLRQYLTQAPECTPNCADYGKMQLNVASNQLTMRLEVQAVSRVAVPLPNSEKGWQIETILRNGQALTALQRDPQGVLWVALEKGSHELILSGSLSDVSAFEIGFQLTPKTVTVLNQPDSIWTVQGIHDQRLSGKSVQFNRVAPMVKQQGQAQTTKTLTPAEMPPFVEWVRTIRLGIDWEVKNEIRRVAPQRGAIHLSIPLLEGEKVLSAEFEVEDRQVKVQLAQNQQRTVWYSKLPIKPLIQLKALDVPQIKEVWQLQSWPMWHVTYSGLPVIHQQSKVGQWLPEWHPWPQETLQIDIIKPEALPGHTLTIDDSRYWVRPGKRKTEHALEMNIRSSQGGQHTLTLPDDIQIQDVLIQQLSQPINLEQNQLTIPIFPGAQHVNIKWESKDALSQQFKTEKISLNNRSANHITQVDITKDRWVLWLSGPEVGPVVRYWSVFVLAVLIAVALGRSNLTPLATWQWLLLGLGVTLSTPLAAIAVVAWFILLNFRDKYAQNLDTTSFQITQVGILIMTGLFIVSLLICITSGLLGNPQMQLAAPNTSIVSSNFIMETKYQFQWYQDQIKNGIPASTVISIPLFVYRILMLIWALWLAFSLLKWFKWGWLCFSKNGLWKHESAKTK